MNKIQKPLIRFTYCILFLILLFSAFGFINFIKSYNEILLLNIILISYIIMKLFILSVYLFINSQFSFNKSTTNVLLSIYVISIILLITSNILLILGLNNIFNNKTLFFLSYILNIIFYIFYCILCIIISTKYIKRKIKFNALRLIILIINYLVWMIGLFSTMNMYYHIKNANSINNEMT